MALNQSRNEFPAELLPQMKASGHPLIVRIDEIVDRRTVKATLLVGSMKIPANRQITIVDPPRGSGGSRSLSEAISGTEKVSKLVPTDIVTFVSAFEYEGQIMVGKISGRTSDAMVGNVQVITAMARPSRSIVNERGAMQSLVVTDGKNGRSAKNFAKIEEVFAWTKAQKWPGGAPGFLIRDKEGKVTEFFEDRKRNITIATLKENYEMDGVFAEPDTILELIPAWRIPMGRDQVTRDINPTQLQAAQAGPFTKKFMVDGKGYPEFMPCTIVLCDEEEWAFKALTGKTMRVAAGVQPIDKLPPVRVRNLPSAVRKYNGTPNGIIQLYDEDTMKLMAQARMSRSANVSVSTPKARQADAPRPAPAPNGGKPFSTTPFSGGRKFGM